MDIIGGGVKFVTCAVGAGVGLVTAPAVGAVIGLHDGYTPENETQGGLLSMGPALTNDEANKYYDKVKKSTGNEFCAKAAGMTAGFCSGLLRGLYQGPMLGIMFGLAAGEKIMDLLEGKNN